MKNKLSTTLAMALILALVVMGTALAKAYNSGDKIDETGTHTLAWTGQGVKDGELETVICPSKDELPEGIDPYSYLHFIFTTDGGSAEVDGTPTLTINESGNYPWFKKNDQNNTFHFYVPYSDLNTLEAYVTFTTQDTGDGAWILTISHGCPGPPKYEELTVSKTAVTSYTREHFWDIAKKVETEKGYTHDGFPKIWLYIDGSGDEAATWTVDVTYKGYADSDFNVSGTININNTGTLDAVITSVEDVLAGTAIGVDCGVSFPYTLAVGETLTCTYDEDGYVEEGQVNEVTVVTERDKYYAFAPIKWGDPDKEINETVTVKDVSDLFGEEELGEVTAPDDATFTYDKKFTWAEYGEAGCGDKVYQNTATIVETGQSVSATLKVNVQCYVYDSAWAKGTPATCFIPTFSQWGWTNKITVTPGSTYTWNLWAGAAQCDTSKGTWVGTVTVTVASTTTNGKYAVTVTYNVAFPYKLQSTAVYAGADMFPRLSKTQFTVAPGQYTNKGPFTSGSTVYVIAHAKVGIPDPNFGP